jgi:uncharacterized protein CbrC (UPF0167 family)
VPGRIQQPRHDPDPDRAGEVGWLPIGPDPIAHRCCATNALKSAGLSASAARFNASQKIGSRLTEVAWPAIMTERFIGTRHRAGFNTCAGRR